MERGNKSAHDDPLVVSHCLRLLAFECTTQKKLHKFTVIFQAYGIEQDMSQTLIPNKHVFENVHMVMEVSGAANTMVTKYWQFLIDSRIKTQKLVVHAPQERIAFQKNVALVLHTEQLIDILHRTGPNPKVHKKNKWAMMNSDSITNKGYLIKFIEDLETIAPDI
jgi:hypothetical protein